MTSMKADMDKLRRSCRAARISINPVYTRWRFLLFSVFGFTECGERTSKLVFCSALVKWHLVHRLQL
jgi:hypothetical protein